MKEREIIQNNTNVPDGNSADNMAAYLFHQGTNFCSYEYMGAHEENDGFVCRTWAPNANRVFVPGDFNSWSDREEMTRITENGIFELRLPNGMINDGDKYKFLIEASDMRRFMKADPYAFRAELPPGTASVVYKPREFKWTDKRYLSSRMAKMSTKAFSMPINIYELHAGSWKRHEDGTVLSYTELADELVPYIKQMGYTHIELMPVSEFPFDGSWGYQVTGFYAPTSRFGAPDDFKSFINSCHSAGIGVILDWVPAHFPKDAHGLYEFDGRPLYEFQGADRMEHEGWGTRKFDIARNEVECFLISNASYWLSEFHIDGLRVDAVASMLYLDYDKKPGQWIPNIYGTNVSLEAVAFFQKLNAHIRGMFPDVMVIAEESTAYGNLTRSVSDGGLGFDFKWNMGWMNDTLSYAETEFDYRHDIHSKTNFSLMYAFSERYVLPVSHDEVVHGKKTFLDRMPGDYWRKFAGSRLFLTYMMCHPGKKLTFMGVELGQFAEWKYKESVEWFLLDYEMHKKHQLFVRDLNAFYLDTPALWRDDFGWNGFSWLRPDDSQSCVSSFIRHDTTGKSKDVIVVLNYHYEARENFVIDLPCSGKYKEVFNSNRTEYGGNGFVNEGVIDSFKGPHGNNLACINLPPIGACVFVLERKDTAATETKKAMRAH